MKPWLRAGCMAALLASAGFAQPTISTLRLPTGTVGVAYNETVLALGQPPFTWSATGSLPPGITLSAAGLLFGTPTAVGTYAFTLNLSDASGMTDSKALSLDILPPPLTVATATLPAGTVGTAYSQTLTATGGTGGYAWSVTAGALPAGVSLAASGIVSGTPSAAATASFTVQVRDSAGSTATAPLAITINLPPLAIATSALPAGTVGTAYSQTLTATGGSGGYTWSVMAGALPAGLSLSVSGVISGTPSAAATASFTVQVRDSAGSTATAPLAITINLPPLAIATSTLPAGTVGTAYSQTLTATGGSGGYTWSVTAGALPAGLSLSVSGIISGTPSTAATSAFTLRVRDSAGSTATAPLAITINLPPLAIATSTLPAGTVGTAYSQTLTATGGSGGYTWSVTAGALPAGLSLAVSGIISGTPSTAATSAFTLRVRDSAGSTASASLAVSIVPPPLAITTTGLASGTAGTPYAQSLGASGGTGAYRWSAVSGSLPSGLTLSAGGAITGTPSSPGLFNFTVQVADGTSTPATRALSITIRAPLAVTGTFPPGTTGVPYGAAAAASGGVPPYSWSKTAGQLPPGLTADNAGDVAGVPTRAGTYSFTLQATDAAGATAAAAFTVRIISNLGVVTPPTLANGSAGLAYQATLAASGGTPPYIWSLISGALPNGLALDGASGVIRGTPTQVGTFTAGVRVTDAYSNTATESVTVTISSGLTIATAPVLPGATAGSPYSQQLQPAGGVPPYVWAATAGSLPAGLLFRASGLIDGTPTAAGSFAITAEVTDGNTTKATKQFTLEVAGPLTITSGPALPGGTIGVPYSQTLAASGGRPPLVWSVAVGTLPPGLSLAATGTLSGTPSASGNFSFTAAVTDSAGVKTQKALTLAVGAGITPTAPSSLPSAVTGTPYTFTFAASGGQQPYTWRVTDGAPPQGLDLNAASGVLSGTPTATGTFNFTVQVTDAARLTASRVHAIVVGLPAAPSLSVNGLPASAGPLEQPQVDVVLSSSFPVPVTGRLNLTFAPAGQNPVDDPAVQFSTGGRSATFTVPANTTHATFTAPQLALQTGSVAGTITVTVDALAAGGAPMQVPPGVTRTVQVNPAAPVIRSLTVTRTGNGFNVVVVALSNTRELTQATVRFQAAASGTLQSSQAVVPLAGVSSTWFKNPDSTAYGGQFTLTLPFTITGSGDALGSISVVLSNSSGDSPTSSAQY